MECKYDCGKKIQVIDFDLLDGLDETEREKRSKENMFKYTRIDTTLSLDKFKLYYEIDDDGDRGDLHMCPEFQKKLDSDLLSDEWQLILRTKTITPEALKGAEEKLVENFIEDMKKEEGIDVEQIHQVFEEFLKAFDDTHCMHHEDPLVNCLI